MGNFNGGIIYGELIKYDTILSNENKEGLRKLMEKLDYDKESLETIKMLIQEASASNYKLGAERQKKATLDSIRRKLDELE